MKARLVKFGEIEVEGTRYTHDVVIDGGKVRTSFGNLGGGSCGAVLQADGKIVAVGFQATSSRGGVDFALARYLGD
jgi:hypothetical protein